MTWRELLLTVSLMGILLVNSVVMADTQSYQLQRRIGSGGEWATISTFALSRSTNASPVRLRSALGANVTDLTPDEKVALASADFVFYRAMAPNRDDAAADAPMVAVTPCSLIRSFDAIDSKTVVLQEKLRVVPGPGTSLIGLQVSSETNFFHSKMLNGDECDRSVIQKLFPVVRMQLHLQMMPHVKLTRTPNYEELRMLQEGSEAQAKPKPKTTTRKVRDANGDTVEEEVPVDDRSFLQKYWMYMVVPLITFVLQNLKAQ